MLCVAPAPKSRKKATKGKAPAAKKAAPSPTPSEPATPAVAAADVDMQPPGAVASDAAAGVESPSASTEFPVAAAKPTPKSPTRAAAVPAPTRTMRKRKSNDDNGDDEIYIDDDEAAIAAVAAMFGDSDDAVAPTATPQLASSPKRAVNAVAPVAEATVEDQLNDDDLDDFEAHPKQKKAPKRVKRAAVPKTVTADEAADADVDTEADVGAAAAAADRVVIPKGTGRERLRMFKLPIHVAVADKKASSKGGKKPSMKLSREQEAMAAKIRTLVWCHSLQGVTASASVLLCALLGFGYCFGVTLGWSRLHSVPGLTPGGLNFDVRHALRPVLEHFQRVPCDRWPVGLV